MPPLSPRQSVASFQPTFDAPCCFHPCKVGSASGASGFEVTYAFTFVAAWWLAHHPKDGFVDELQSIGFPPLCHPSYIASVSTMVGFRPTEHVRLRLDAPYIPHFVRCGLWNFQGPHLLRPRWCLRTADGARQGVAALDGASLIISPGTGPPRPGRRACTNQPG